MRLRSNKQITNINNSIMSLESSIEVRDISDSEIDDDEVEDLKHDMTEFINHSNPPHHSNTQINLPDTHIVTQYLDYESEDEEYEPITNNG